jgi:hypothetical protein
LQWAYRPWKPGGYIEKGIEPRPLENIGPLMDTNGYARNPFWMVD